MAGNDRGTSRVDHPKVRAAFEFEAAVLSVLLSGSCMIAFPALSLVARRRGACGSTARTLAGACGARVIGHDPP